MQHQLLQVFGRLVAVALVVFVATVLAEFASGQLAVAVAALDLYIRTVDPQVILKVDLTMELFVALETSPILLTFVEVRLQVPLRELHERAQIRRVVDRHGRWVPVAAVVRLEDSFELPPHCEVLALREQQLRVLEAAWAPGFEI